MLTGVVGAGAVAFGYLLSVTEVPYNRSRPPAGPPASPAPTDPTVLRPARLWEVRHAVTPRLGTIAVTADAVYAGGQGGVAALIPATGNVRWRFDAPPAGEGFARDMVALAVDRGMVYVATYAAVHALDDASRVHRWSTPLPTEPFGGLVGVSAADGQLCATAGNTLLRLDPASGQVLWTHRVRARYASSPVIANGVCLVTGGASVEAVSDGRVLWRHEDSRENATDMTAVDGTAFIVVNDEPSALTALDVATGSVRWTTPIAVRPSPLGPPAVADGVVSVLSDGQVHAFDARLGTPLWRAPGSGAGPASVWPAAGGGHVYSGGHGLRLVAAFDAATGALRWEEMTDEPAMALAASTVAAGTGFVLSLGGTVTAFGTA